MSEQDTTAKFLQENKAWNWVWPGDVDGKVAVIPGSQLPDGSGGTLLPRNCWFTGLKPRNPNSKRNGVELQGKQSYCGPSKSTLKRRATRRGLRATEASQLARHSTAVAQ